MTLDHRSTVRVSEKTIQALGSLAIKGTESLYDKDSTPSHGPPGGFRVSGRQLERIKESLSDLELNILSSVKDCRLITTLQLQRLHFAHFSTPYLAARACRRTLQKLTLRNILTRRHRRIGGARLGSTSYVYSLGLLGARIVSPDKRLRPYIHDPSDYFLKHSLAEAEFYTQIHEAARAGNFELLEVQTEPYCWRIVPYFSKKLRADMFIRLATKDEELSFFIEIDRGSTHLPSILIKARAYEAYFRTGIEQLKHSVFPKVVWVVPDSKRATECIAALTSTNDLTKELFEVVTMQAAVLHIANPSKLAWSIAT